MDAGAVTVSTACLRMWGLGVIDYRMLGPIEAGVDGRRLEIGGRKQRALLAILLLSANEPVSRACLAERLWGERPPRVRSTRWRCMFRGSGKC